MNVTGLTPDQERIYAAMLKHREPEAVHEALGGEYEMEDWNAAVDRYISLADYTTALAKAMQASVALRQEHGVETTRELRALGFDDPVDPVELWVLDSLTPQELDFLGLKFNTDGALMIPRMR